MKFSGHGEENFHICDPGLIMNSIVVESVNTVKIPAQLNNSHKTKQQRDQSQPVSALSLLNYLGTGNYFHTKRSKLFILSQFSLVY
jgi:hypothetical protein